MTHQEKIKFVRGLAYGTSTGKPGNCIAAGGGAYMDDNCLGCPIKNNQCSHINARDLAKKWLSEHVSAKLELI
jgi:hypothetical protein